MNGLSNEINYNEHAKYEFKCWRKIENGVAIFKFESIFHNLNEIKIKNQAGLRMDFI